MDAAGRDHLPLTTHLVLPKLADIFRVDLISRGYPPPDTQFRGCTDRLKVYPVSRAEDSGKQILVAFNHSEELVGR